MKALTEREMLQPNFFRQQNHLPDRDQLVEFSPEEAARLLLRLWSTEKRAFIPAEGVGAISDRAYGRDPEVERVLMEGVAYLERYGLLVEDSRAYSPTGRGRVLSRLGERLASSASELEGFISRISDPRALLHPTIRATALPLYERGSQFFETAVFEAFKAVEVAVRDAAGLPAEHIGVKMMRRVFSKGGELWDATAEPGEEDGIRDLFAGAIGVFKNPPSHRAVAEWLDAAGVLRMLVFASELLSILERRLGGG